VLRLCHEHGVSGEFHPCVRIDFVITDFLAKVQKLVSCLSTCIFPDNVSYPINEGMLHDGPPHHSNFGYAYAKRMLDISSRAYRVQFGCNFVSIIPTNIYGPNDNFSDGCHFVPSFLKRVAEARKSAATTITVPGSGNALRQFIFSRDLARLMIWSLRSYNDTEPLIISVDPEQEVSIKDIALTICRLSGFDGKIEWDKSQTDGQQRKTADNQRMKMLVDNFNFTSLEEGVFFHILED
jgi:GDP-L-fucose synthase